MRALVRLWFAHPALVFALLLVAAIGVGLVAFVMAERRARAMAELAGDDRAKSGQRLRLLLVGIGVVTAAAAIGWWKFARVHTEPQRVVVAVALDLGDGQLLPAWQQAQGSLELATKLSDELEQLGLTSTPIDAEAAELARGDMQGFADATLVGLAQGHEARWVIRVVVRVDKTLPLIGADFSDYVLSVDASVIDSETSERWSATEPALRAFLWGESPAEALTLNAEYLSDRLTMPIVARLGEREPLQAFVDPQAMKGVDDQLLARKLVPLFDRSDNLAQGLAQREHDRALALEREPQNRAQVTRTRLGDVLAEEYMLGTAFDGRPIVLVDRKEVSVVPGKLGYVVGSEGEALELVEGPSRALLFEHYNFYGAADVSADGRVVWATLANHGSSKTLATITVPEGVFTPVFTDPLEYMTNPTPTPDGSRAVFHARPERYSETALDIIDRDGQNRRRLVEAGEVFGRPAWAAKGPILYLPIDEWSRIVAIDVDTLSRTHLLGQPPEGAAILGLQVEAPPQLPDAETDAELADAETDAEDPRTTSRFPALALGHDGSYLFVLEDALDGVRWVGRFGLQEGSYTRLGAMDAEWLIASPTAEQVAVQVRGFTGPTKLDDPQPGDDEILILGSQPDEVSLVTLDSEDDELIGWSRDGVSVFALQRDVDPGAPKAPVVRVYRYDLQADPTTLGR